MSDHHTATADLNMSKAIQRVDKRNGGDGSEGVDPAEPEPESKRLRGSNPQQPQSPSGTLTPTRHSARIREAADKPTMACRSEEPPVQQPIAAAKKPLPRGVVQQTTQQLMELRRWWQRVQRQVGVPSGGSAPATGAPHVDQQPEIQSTTQQQRQQQQQQQQPLAPPPPSAAATAAAEPTLAAAPDSLRRRPRKQVMPHSGCNDGPADGHPAEQEQQRLQFDDEEDDDDEDRSSGGEEQLQTEDVEPAPPSPPVIRRSTRSSRGRKEEGDDFWWGERSALACVNKLGRQQHAFTAAAAAVASDTAIGLAGAAGLSPSKSTRPQKQQQQQQQQQYNAAHPSVPVWLQQSRGRRRSSDTSGASAARDGSSGFGSYNGAVDYNHGGSGTASDFTEDELDAVTALPFLKLTPPGVITSAQPSHQRPLPVPAATNQQPSLACPLSTAHSMANDGSFESPSAALLCRETADIALSHGTLAPGGVAGAWSGCGPAPDAGLMLNGAPSSFHSSSGSNWLGGAAAVAAGSGGSITGGFVKLQPLTVTGTQPTAAATAATGSLLLPPAAAEAGGGKLKVVFRCGGSPAVEAPNQAAAVQVTLGSGCSLPQTLAELAQQQEKQRRQHVLQQQQHLVEQRRQRVKQWRQQQQQMQQSSEDEDMVEPLNLLLQAGALAQPPMARGGTAPLVTGPHIGAAAVSAHSGGGADPVASADELDAQQLLLIERLLGPSANSHPQHQSAQCQPQAPAFIQRQPAQKRGLFAAGSGGVFSQQQPHPLIGGIQHRVRVIWQRGGGTGAGAGAASAGGASATAQEAVQDEDTWMKPVDQLKQQP